MPSETTLSWYSSFSGNFTTLYTEFHCECNFIFFLHFSKIRWNRKISWFINTYHACNFLALSNRLTHAHAWVLASRYKSAFPELHMHRVKSFQKSSITDIFDDCPVSVWENKISQNIQKFKPEDHSWSSIAHLSTGDVKISDYLEEKKFKNIELDQGQWMTLIFGTHKVSCTHFSWLCLPTFKS